jgi:D-inositol-3-phosphate glycosyltransferase
MRRLAVLSMHTSPLAQPGVGDSGGMNVYVRELSSALARAGVACDVYTRSSGRKDPPSVVVEPGFVVHHVEAGPRREVDKSALWQLVPAFAEGVAALLDEQAERGAVTDALHANYWLSGVAGHALKHRLELPLVATFHTLDRVKAEAEPEERDGRAAGRRAAAEAEVVGCADALLASCAVEAEQLVELYGADPARIEIVAPGVDRAVFSPGDRGQARRALGLAPAGPLLLFVGRIQPLKGASIALGCLQALDALGVEGSELVLVGGPSGPEGPGELAQLRSKAHAAGLERRVRFVPPQSRELLSTYYRAADACLVPSRSESFGLVALEAAACGVPVVASAVGGLTTLVEDGLTGFLVELSGSPEAISREFAARVAQLWARPGRAREMGAAAAARAGGYTWPVAAARLRRLYQELTARSLVDCR